MFLDDVLDRADPRELIDGYADGLGIRLGFAVADPHPFAEHMAREGDMPLKELARRVNRLPRDIGPGELGRALGGSDFGDSLETALRKIVGLAWGTASGNWDATCQILPSRGTHPVEAPTIELGELTALPRSGTAELVPIKVESGNAVTPQRYAFRFLVSRTALLGDEVDLVAAWVAHLTTQSARLLPRLIGGILTANPDLADNSPLIGASNTTSATGIDVTSLGEAFQKVRTATSPGGQITAAAPKFLVVPPAKELAARILVASASVGADAPVIVLCNPWSGADTYLLADPSEAPVFGAVYPGTSNRRPTVYRVAPVIEQPDGSLDHFDGQMFVHETMIGVGAINRLGIVRIPAA